MSQRVANRPETGLAGPLAHLAGVLVLAVLFSLGGAYDTDELGLMHRLALWLLVSILLVGQTVVIEHTLARILPSRAVFRLVSGAGAALLTLLLVTLELDLHSV